MRIIISFAMSMIPYMLVAIPPYIVARVILVKVRKVPVYWPREIVMFLFAVFLVGLASQTIIPGVVSNGSHSMNFVPFKFIYKIYTEVFLNKNVSYLLINIMGNIILFIPIGFVVPLLWRVSRRMTMVIGFLSSLFIEVCQLFLLRGTDVDDLLLNAFGVMLGILIYRTLQKHRVGVVEKFKITG